MHHYTKDLTTDEYGTSIYPIDDKTLKFLEGKRYWVLAYSEDFDDVEYKWYLNVEKVYADGTFEWYGMPAFDIDTDFTQESLDNIYRLPMDGCEHKITPLDWWKIYLPLELLSNDELWEIAEANTQIISQLPGDGDEYYDDI